MKLIRPWMPLKNWIDFKTEIAQMARNYGISRAKKNKRDINKVENQINMLIQEQFLNIAQRNRLTQLKVELENWYAQKAKASIFRNKVNWIRQGEKNTKYFMGLEKQKGYNQGIHALYGDDKQVTFSTGNYNTQTDAILGRFVY